MLQSLGVSAAYSATPSTVWPGAMFAVHQPQFTVVSSSPSNLSKLYACVTVRASKRYVSSKYLIHNLPR